MLRRAFSNCQHSGSGVGRISLGALEAVVEMASGSGLDGCLCIVHLPSRCSFTILVSRLPPGSNDFIHTLDQSSTITRFQIVTSQLHY